MIAFRNSLGVTGSAFVLVGLLSLVSACSSKTPDAVSPESAQLDAQMDAQAAANLAGQAVDAGADKSSATAQQSSSDCTGFVDGSSRENTLAGVALGDSLEKVSQQFRCGKLTFDLEQYEVSNSDYTLLLEGHAILFISGKNGNESVDLNFIGVPGDEKLVSITRSAEYGEEPGPSVDGLVKSILAKYKNSKILDKNVGYASSTRIGFGTSADGRQLTGQSAIGNCSSRMGGDPNCGTTLYAMVDPDMKRNPELLKGYEIRMFDMSKYNKVFKYTTIQLKLLEAQRMKKEVENAGNVRGI